MKTPAPLLSQTSAQAASSDDPDGPAAMTPSERKATMYLAFLFGARMLGLFLILPVFALHARSLPGGDNATMVGLAMGMYGLTQGLLQIPFGMASDRLGRKKVIVFGLLLYALGSLVAALSDTLTGVTLGRAIQGTGAISAAVTALLADCTRDSQRTKAMAVIGSSIGLMFSLSLVAAPLLYKGIGMSGMFDLMAGLALLGIVIVLQVEEPPKSAGPLQVRGARRSDLRVTLANMDLMRLNFGVFVLHAVQMAMFVVVPAWLVEHAGLSLPDHWKVYLPVVLASFVLMVPVIIMAERKGRMKMAFVGSIALIALVQLGLALQPSGLMSLAGLLLMFFVGFNVLEATLPSLISKLAPQESKGTALGVYNTVQALGVFVGAGLGGWLVQHHGGVAVFWCCAAGMAAWCGVAMGQKRWKAAPRPTVETARAAAPATV